MSSADELRKLVKEVCEDPKKYRELSEKQAAEVRKAINPYATNIKKGETFDGINISIINWKDQYLRKLHMTALISFMYCMLSEYDPRKPNKGYQEIKMTDEQVKFHKAVIKRFLDRNLVFNADRHVRVAKSSNASDPERKSDDQLKADLEAARQHVQESQLNEDDLKKIVNASMGAYQTARMAADDVYRALKCVDETRRLVPSGSVRDSLDDQHSILYKRWGELNARAEELRVIVSPIAQVESAAAVTVNPPVDVFYNFNRYLTNHYEQIVNVIASAYNEKPDIEFSAIYYGHFSDESDAKDHRIKYNEEFSADVMTLEKGVSLLGPFKENNSRIDFYNKNTEIMKRMMQQMEADHKLGKDLMEKTVKTKKAQNIIENGVDADELTVYNKALGTIDALGAKKVLTAEEQEELARAKVDKEMFEVPDDAIQVDVIAPVHDEEGKPVALERSHFYTQAEEPLHMAPDSAFKDQYQPKRSDGQKLSKTILSKDGKKKLVVGGPKSSSDATDNIKSDE